ncbi:hypothetical protein BLA29_002821 [Euroglyphus maynei]|uniref:Uncharacterized protein n=1 Tax=Euroglyphus maynei TaxID=6958 RepID=A0A1Y3BF52_EURMA|nr:hypothetical protein BLA29_002821 [Euroglyphus maynei]
MTGPSSFMSMLRPMSSQPPIGGRRSSLTSRLRNIMNAIFYRNENNSPMMTSGSSYSYSYRPAPYGFGNTGGSSSSSSSGSNSDMSEYSSLYGGISPTTYLYGSGPKSSMYGAASNYRPSFVAMPSSSAPSPYHSASGSMQSMYGRNYGYLPPQPESTKPLPTTL